MQRFWKGLTVGAALALACVGAAQAQVAQPLERARVQGWLAERGEPADFFCRAVYVRGWTENGVNQMSRENTTCAAPAGAALGAECACSRALPGGATEVASGRVARRVTGVLHPRETTRVSK